MVRFCPVERPVVRRDSGPWILGKKVMLPAGVISGVDRDEEDLRPPHQEQIKHAPEYDDSMRTDETYRG